MNTPTEISNPSAIQRASWKDSLKRALQAQPRLWSGYWRTKQQIRRVLLLRFFLYDIRHTLKAMYWGEGQADRVTLAARLLFNYHKLEKGMVMPGPRRMFGVEPALAVIILCRLWIATGRPRSDPVFIGAIETLAAYARRLQESALDLSGIVLPKVLAFLNEVPERSAQLITPQPLPTSRVPGLGADGTSFTELALARRSVREFQSEPVPANILTRAAEAAQLAPSACNRQPCRLLIVSTDEEKQALLAHQNGNRGFGHLAPQVAILTADEGCFFDASERHEPYIDGGLFAMNFILSLRDQGVGSCCLNWCVPPATDLAVHRLFNIPQSQRIIMLVAIGFEPPDCMVPRSPRRATSDVLLFYKN
ncbi:nitroreductase family protein [Polaromonas hydrogenivorans]|uniref:Nitroreductase family protein n=1 Tax=Polaromonas hydrogenivorans TaxID=335476 RepID=A0AAU7LW78_9BURK